MKDWENLTSRFTIKLQYPDSVILAKEKQIDQWNTIESPEINSCIYGQRHTQLHRVIGRGEPPELLSLSATTTVLLVALNMLLEARRGVGEENYLIAWCFLWGFSKGVRRSEAGMGVNSPPFPILPLNRLHWGPWTIFFMLLIEQGDLTFNSVHISSLKSACLGFSPASVPVRWVTSVKLLNFSVPEKHTTPWKCCLWELNEIIHVMNFSQSLVWHMGNSQKLFPSVPIYIRGTEGKMVALWCCFIAMLTFPNTKIFSLAN